MSELFQNILTASFHGSIVILAVLVLRLVLKKTPKKFLCLLWLLAGVRLLMPFEIQSTMSLQPEPKPVAEVRQEMAELVSPGPELIEIPGRSEETAHIPAVSENAPMPEDVEVITGPAVITEESHTVTDFASIAAWIWLSMASLFLVYTIASYVHLKLLVRESVKIPGGWECDRIETAFILGFIRPKIYIPMGLSKVVRKHILAHERTHLEKGDHWFKMIGFLALALHWFNPLVWVAYILLCKDIEMACDERVVQFMELQERKEYSAALLNCSTNRAHFAACPVAFGEVSVKERIKSVLKYKKPGFWISLAGVIAIVFVAVCLVTSPVEEAPAMAGTTPTETGSTEAATEPTVQSTFAAGLTQTEIVQICTDTINDLKARESYSFNITNNSIYPERENSTHTYVTAIRRYGNDYLALMQERLDNGEPSYTGSQLYFGDMYGMHYGDYWVNEGARREYDVNSWLNQYTPEGKTVTFPEGTGVVSDDSVSFAAQWTREQDPGYQYDAIITFTFHNDGSLARIFSQYTTTIEGYEPEEKQYYTADLALIDEDPADTYSIIADHAGSCISLEQLEVLRKEARKVTEIPSNKTEYDKDFMLGSGQMRWYFFDEAWQFACGTENPTATGTTIFYCESGDDHKSLTAGEGFWIEQLVDGKWTVLEPASPVTNAPEEAIQVSWSGRDTVKLDWTDSYGALPHGFYRVGRYHTATMPDGRSETIHAYAKFRIYNPNQDALLAKCRAAIDNLLNADSYHLYSFDWMTESVHDDKAYYMSSEVWKHGPDYLEVTSYPSRDDLSVMTSVRGSMWRDGKYYGLDWESTPAHSPVVGWNGCVDGYMDDSNFSMWSWDFEWYDAKVEEVREEGNTIRIIETYDFDDQYEATEITLTFDSSGNLKSMTNAFLPTRNCAQSEKVIEEELVVFDTAAAEIGALIEAQDIDSPMPFSYEEDVRANPNAQTTGFKNTTVKAITTPAEAIARADKESTMEPLMEFQTGYCQYMTYHDDTAGIWKVEMFWWQHDTMQTVYMTDDGITKMLVSVE